MELELVQFKNDDPDGLKQLGAVDGLEQAYKLLNPLSTLILNNNIDVSTSIDYLLCSESIMILHDFAGRLQAVSALNRTSDLN